MESDEIWTPQEPRIIEAKEALMNRKEQSEMWDRMMLHEKCMRILFIRFFKQETGSRPTKGWIASNFGAWRKQVEAEARAAMERAK